MEEEAAQKKVDILQKALRHHPDSEEIVLRLITATQAFQEEEEVHRRWQVKDIECGFKAPPSYQSTDFNEAMYASGRNIFRNVGGRGTRPEECTSSQHKSQNRRIRCFLNFWKFIW
jgi:hypothetical protein